MFKCLCEISSQGKGAVGKKISGGGVEITLSTVAVAVRLCDSIIVICYQSHKNQIKHTALKQGLWVYFISHLQGSHRCLSVGVQIYPS